MNRAYSEGENKTEPKAPSDCGVACFMHGLTMAAIKEHSTHILTLFTGVGAAFSCFLSPSVEAMSLKFSGLA